MNKMNARFTLAAMAALALAPAALAATTITVDSVVQRWPWNNKLDITYTVNDGQDVSASTFKKIVFTAVIGGTTYTIDGVTDVGASANTGTHTVTWTVPSGVKDPNCTMTAAVYAADAPSGDDYLVVNLLTGAKSFEGLLATQADSNARYHANMYKGDYMVLRKIPAGGTYPTGDSMNYASSNSARTWTTDRDYYIGIYPVTQGQYQQVGADTGVNPSNSRNTASGSRTDDQAWMRPVDQVSWNDLRLATTATTSAIPAVATAGSGTFFQRMNFKTGLYFDLPTEVMSEIAARAGATTVYSWGDTPDGNYAINGSGATRSFGIGIVTPNDWGLYDTAGNVYEVCLDDYSSGDRAARTDPFTPFHVDGSTTKGLRGGGSWGNNINTSTDFHASANKGVSSTERYFQFGFRVALVVE